MDALTPRDPVDDSAALALRRLEARPSLALRRAVFTMTRAGWGIQDAMRPALRALGRASREAARKDFTLAGG